MNMIRISLALTAILVSASASRALIIHVPVDCGTIQAGISEAMDGDTVLVDRGIYYENIFFQSRAILLCSNYIFDGDTTTIHNTIIDGSFSGSTVIFAGFEDANSILNGFTIRGGDDTYGGGIYCWYSSPTIANNVIEENNADYGGGIHCLHSSAQIRSNVIHSNYAYAGGGIYGEYCRLIVDGNRMSNNLSTYGGGMLSVEAWSLNFTNNVVVDNFSSSGAGGLYIYKNWNYYYLFFSIVGNTFKSNVTYSEGGGIFLDFDCYPWGSEFVCRNNIFVKNYGSEGGGMYVHSLEHVTLDILSNTFVENTSLTAGGGIYCERNSNVRNNIFSGNVSLESTGGDIYFGQERLTNYNDFWENEPDDYDGAVLGNGNIFCDPEFDEVNPDECLISAGSPCIDSGDKETSVPKMGGDRVDIGANEYSIAFNGSSQY